MPLDAEEARQQVAQIDAKVLSNRKPPYSLKGGLYDALTATNGDMFAVTNEEAAAAAALFEKTEGIDIEPAAGVAVASLRQAIERQQVEKDAVVMLNITGGGVRRFKAENRLVYKTPDYVFPITASPEEIKKVIAGLFD